ncbi:helicase RepA family protein [Porticoccaceae bacterium]|nr:helicase RepA family protein [Porticoccaceae bacterium]
MLEPQIAINNLIDQYDRDKGNNIGTLVNIAKANGWTRASPFDVLSELEDVELLQPVTAQKYIFLTRDDILALPKMEWRIKGVLPTRGVSAIYGPSSSGKSFLAIDLAAAICSGSDWFEKKCKPTSVIYIGLEGSAGIQNRVKAWEVGRNKQLPPNFSVVLADFNLTDAADIQAIIDQTPKASVLIIDTLNRATPGRDENSSSDMGLTLAAAKCLEQAIEGLVVLIHHTGKDQAKGLRGHSSLYAALDSAIAVTKNDKSNTKTWSLAKSKDEVDQVNFGFRLQPHVIGKDEDGGDETSCTIEPESSFVPQMSEPTSSRQKPAFKAIKSIVSDSSFTGMAGAPFYTNCTSLDSTVIAVVGTLGTVAQSKRKNTAKRLIEQLCSNGYLTSGIDDEGDAWYWLPER